MRRFLRSHVGATPLAGNQAHQFALSHALRIFEPNALYTLIPKNGCSTMRLSIALANGCIDEPSQVSWIHANNRSFPATTESAFLADYTFVVIRCPYQRLYSVFMDKIVNIDVESWNLFDRTRRRVFPHELTFRRFLKLIEGMPRQALDIHWRPQVDFLLFQEYDDYFGLENFGAAEQTLRERIGLTLVDSRPYLGHEISSVNKLEGVVGAADLPAIELLMMKREGTLPDPASMYDEGTFAATASLYADDVAFHRDRIGQTPLMAHAA